MEVAGRIGVCVDCGVKEVIERMWICCRACGFWPSLIFVQVKD